MANEKRLIDAYKLEDLVRSNSARYHHADDVIAAIAGQPTVDAVEVVHGRWIWTITGEEDYEQYYRCSECNDHVYSKYNYCSNCGAKMDGGNEDA